MIGQQVNKHLCKQKPTEYIICNILYPVGGEYADAGTGRGGTGDEGGVKRVMVFIIHRSRSYSTTVKIIWSVNK